MNPYQRRWATLARRHGAASLRELRTVQDRLAASDDGWPPGCTTATARVLAVLERGPATSREIAAVLGLTRHTVTHWHLTTCRHQRWIVPCGWRGQRSGMVYRLAAPVIERRQRFQAMQHGGE